MSNILHFPSTKTTSASRRAAAERMPQAGRSPAYAAVPAHITSNPTLNRAVTSLQTNGWLIDSIIHGGITFTHPKFEGRYFTITEALYLQRERETQSA